MTRTNMINACYYQAHDVLHMVVKCSLFLRTHATRFGRTRNDIHVSNVSEEEVLRIDVTRK